MPNWKKSTTQKYDFYGSQLIKNIKWIIIVVFKARSHGVSTTQTILLSFCTHSDDNDSTSLKLTSCVNYRVFR